MNIRFENKFHVEYNVYPSLRHVRLASNVDICLAEESSVTDKQPRARLGSHWQVRALSKKELVCRSKTNVMRKTFYPYYLMIRALDKIDYMCSSDFSIFCLYFVLMPPLALVGAFALPFYLLVTPLTFALAVITEVGKIIYYKSTHVAVIDDFSRENEIYYLRQNHHNNLLSEGLSARDPKVSYTKISEILAHQKIKDLSLKDSPMLKYDAMHLLVYPLRAGDYQSIIQLLDLGVPATGFTFQKKRDDELERWSLYALIYHELQEAGKGGGKASEIPSTLHEKLLNDDEVKREIENGVFVKVSKLDNPKNVTNRPIS